jgi:hypothetical protein
VKPNKITSDLLECHWWNKPGSLVIFSNITGEAGVFSREAHHQAL